jgi:hypothetical protein
MILKPNLERLIYALVIILSLAVLGLLLLAPPDLMNAHAVYQGF